MEKLERQLVWATLMISVPLRGHHGFEGITLTLNDRLVVALSRLSNPTVQYTWGFVKQELTAWATAPSWSLLKPMPSVQGLTLYVVEELVRP